MGPSPSLESILERVARGECVASPELVRMAEERLDEALEEPVDVERWAEDLARDLCALPGDE